MLARTKKTLQLPRKLSPNAVAAALQTALNEKGHAVLAVSGGRSPIAFFEALSQKDLNWQNVGITLVDERIVPTTHADSNNRLGTRISAQK